MKLHEQTDGIVYTCFWKNIYISHPVFGRRGTSNSTRKHADKDAVEEA